MSQKLCPASTVCAWGGHTDGYQLSDSLRCSVPVPALIQCPALISLLRYQWTSDGWDDPLGAPDLDPWRGCVEEDCSEAFDDVGFHAWC